MAPLRQLIPLQRLTLWELQSMVLSFSARHVQKQCVCTGSSIKCWEILRARHCVHLPEVIREKFFAALEYATQHFPENQRSVVLKISEPARIIEVFTFRRKCDSYYMPLCTESITTLFVSGDQLVSYELEDPLYPKNCLVPMVNLKHLVLSSLDEDHSVFSIIGEQCYALKVLVIDGPARNNNKSNRIIRLFFDDYSSNARRTALCNTLEEFCAMYLSRSISVYAEYFFRFMPNLRILNMNISRANFPFYEQIVASKIFFLIMRHCTCDLLFIYHAFTHFPELANLSLNICPNDETFPEVFTMLRLIPNLTYLHLSIHLPHRELFFDFLESRGDKLKLLCVKLNHNNNLPVENDDLFDLAEIATFCPNLTHFYWSNHNSKALICTRTVKLCNLKQCVISLMHNCHRNNFTNALESVTSSELVMFKSLGTVDDEDIENILSADHAFTNLRKLSFFKANSLTEKSIRNLVYKCPKLILLQSAFGFIVDKSRITTLRNEFNSHNLMINLHVTTMESIQTSWTCSPT